MKQITVHVESYEPFHWAYLQRSAGDPYANLHLTLNWILEQLLLGNAQPQFEKDGEVVSLTIGKDAAPRYESSEECLGRAKERLRYLNIQGVLAKCREEGTEPKYRELVDELHLTATEGDYNRTEYHYGFQLVKVLERIRNLGFILSEIQENGSVLFAPLIEGKSSHKTIWYLGEATRCYLYGLHRACIVLSRTCLEESLSVKLTTETGRNALAKFAKECRDKKDNPGELESLIHVASSDLGYLDSDSFERADSIRKRGNAIAHRRTVKEEESREVLSDLRIILNCLFSG